VPTTCRPNITHWVFALFCLYPYVLWCAPVINEVQSSNTSLPDTHGQLIDWVEIYNPDLSSFDLSGHYLSDSTSNRIKFQFPSGTTIGPGGYLIVWCGQSTEFTTLGPYPAGQLRATNFNISSGGEAIVLSGANGTTVIDEYPALAIGTTGTPAVGRSMGRGMGANFGVLYFYNTPTRGTANTTAGTEAIPIDPPTVSLPAGIYSTSQTVTLTSAVPNGTIRYTLDGSEPTESSSAYSAPISLGFGGNNSTQYSWIPTAPTGSGIDDWRQPNGSVSRIHVLRTRLFKTGAASRTVTKSYIIDSMGTDRYRFPIVSVASDPANLFNNQTGIYVPGANTYSTDWPNTVGAVPSEFWANYYQSGSEWERASHLELFEMNGAQLIEGAIGLRINGNTTRNRPRKALRIYNRNPSGSTTWANTALFPDRNTRSWSTFLLRASGNDWNQSLFRDALVSAIAAPTGLDRQAARPVVLFLNGEYWGIHNLRERIDEDWIFHNFGLPTDQFAVLEVTSGGANFLNPTSDNSQPIFDFGNTALLSDYKDILARAGNNEFSGDSGYAGLNSRVDVANFIDYSAVTIWSGNTDWPGNNVLMWRSLSSAPNSNPKLDGRWRYILKDNDFALGLNFNYVPGYNSNVTQMAQFDTLSYATTPVATTWANNEISTRLLRKALENTTFRNQFINRFADLLNTSLSAHEATTRLDEHVTVYQTGVQEHFSRWPNSINWSNEVERIRGYLQARPAAVRGHIINKFGLTGTAQLSAGVTHPNQGVVTVNSLKIEPSTSGVGANSANWTGTYFKGVPVTIKAEAKPGYRFSGWSRSAATTETVHSADVASNYTSWANDSNLGSGFLGWVLTSSNANSSKAGHFLQITRGGWGLYANSSEWSSALRPFEQPLAVGRALAVRLQHGIVSEPGVIEVVLANSDSQPLFKLERRWDSSFYWVNGQVTGVAVTTSVLDLEFLLTSSTSFSLKLTPVGGVPSAVTGTLMSHSNANVTQAIFKNYSAGFGGGADFFITSMRITTPGSALGSSYNNYSTSSVLTENLEGDVSYLANYVVEPATTLEIVRPTSGAVGSPLATIQVRAVNSIGDADSNYQGLVTLTIAGPGGFQANYQTSAVNGVASFTAINLPSTGSYSLNASSGSLSDGPTASLTVNESAVFLSSESAVWQVATNWSTGTIPNGTRAAVTIPGNFSVNRDVTNAAPLTVSSILFSNGSSTNRNRLNGITRQALTFQSEGGTSSITVTGTGTGFANIEVAGGVNMANDLVLNVQNIAAGNTEYGALRLQGNWSGSGRIIKRGEGIAGITGGGKTFSGNVVIEQGVLTFSEPAISGNSVTNYSVLSGGQLRLSSASSAVGVPRSYLFKGPLRLAGLGRTGIPENENQGNLGALRLETGSTGTVAVLTNRVELTANADIHVPATNTISLLGELTGSDALTKSGGGTLSLGTNTTTFSGSIQVSRGILNLDGVQLTNLLSMNLANETTLMGRGAISGGVILQAGAVLESNQGATPGSAPLAMGGFVVQGPSILNLKFVGTPTSGIYPVMTCASGIEGLSYLTLMGVPPGLSANLIQQGNTVSAILFSSPSEAWLLKNALPLNGLGAGDWSLDLDGNGLSLMEEYFFGVTPATPVLGSALVQSEVEPAGPTLSFLYRRNKTATDLTGTAVWSDTLESASWSSSGITDIQVQNDLDYETRRASVPILPGESRKFMRIKIEKP
jgi:autotransporter-associated beta strand protein